MTNSRNTKPSIKDVGAIKRRAVQASQEALITTEQLGDTALPLVIRPAAEQLDLVTWASAGHEYIKTLLAHHGGLLFRGFTGTSIAMFEKFVEAVSGAPLAYTERSSPRTQVAGHIYTSTEQPPDQEIFLHNEQSYNLTFPLKICFYCVTPAQQGGETPIADVRKVYARIRPELRERFAQRHYMYVRNFGDGFGMPWQTVFQTDDPAEVEAYCRNNNIMYEWKAGGRLRTRQIRRAIARHPHTGELVWFNHLTFFHLSTLAPHIRSVLMEQFAEQELPNNTYYGDGAPIEPEIMEELRACYQAETVVFPWQTGDMLLLDNMLVAHGRASFVGPRKVVVAMAEPIGWDQVAQ